MAAQPEGPFPIRYAVNGGSARIDLAITVAADGSAAVDVLTEPSLPQGHPVRLGRFQGQLGPDLTAQLLAWATGPAGYGGMAGPVPPGTVARLLGTGGDDPDLVDPSAVPEGMDEALASAAASALANPVAALEVGADTASATLAIRSIGSEAVPLLLFARDAPGYWVRVWRLDSAGRQVYLPYEAVEALAGSGQLPEGPVDLAPGDALSVPLPPPREGDGSQGGGFMFWRRGTGPERRLIIGTW